MKAASIFKPFKKKVQQSVEQDVSILPTNKSPRKASHLFIPRFQSEATTHTSASSSTSRPVLPQSRSAYNLTHRRSNSFDRPSLKASRNPPRSRKHERPATSAGQTYAKPDWQETSSSTPRRPPPLQLHSSAFVSAASPNMYQTAGRTSISPPLGSTRHNMQTTKENHGGVPELDGVWKGFLQDVKDDLDSPERHGFQSPATTPTRRHHERTGSDDSTLSDDFCVFDALPPSFSHQLTGSTLEIPAFHTRHGIPESPHIEDFSLSLFPSPPPRPHTTKRGGVLESLSISPSPTFPPPISPSTSSDSSAPSTPTTPRASERGTFIGITTEASSPLPLSPTTGKPTINSKHLHNNERYNLPLRQARSAFNLRSLGTHKVTSSGSTSYALPYRNTAAHGAHFLSPQYQTESNLSLESSPASISGPDSVNFGYAM